MREAVISLQRSIGAGEPPIDAWQAAQFARLGIARRDPMSVTMTTLVLAEQRGEALRQGDERDYARMIDEASYNFSSNVTSSPGLIGRRRSAMRSARL